MENPLFQQFINQNEAYLRRLAIHLTGNRLDAEDLYQETMFKIVANECKFDISTNFKFWSQTIMRNTMINNFRRKARHRTSSVDTTESFFINTVAGSTFNDGASTMTMEFLNAVIGGLEDKYRIPFQLYIDGMKYDEMTEYLQIPVEKLRTCVFSAKRLLQEKLRNYRYDIAA
jgi:RNA polymerase sigma factor (sigma-70 family)